MLTICWSVQNCHWLQGLEATWYGSVSAGFLLVEGPDWDREWIVTTQMFAISQIPIPAIMTPTGYLE